MVPVSGFWILVPTVSRSKAEISLDERDKRCKREANDYLATLEIEKCELGDSGLYTLKVGYSFIFIL